MGIQFHKKIMIWFLLFAIFILIAWRSFMIRLYSFKLYISSNKNSIPYIWRQSQFWFLIYKLLKLLCKDFGLICNKSILHSNILLSSMNEVFRLLSRQVKLYDVNGWVCWEKWQKYDYFLYSLELSFPLFEHLFMIG